MGKINPNLAGKFAKAGQVRSSQLSDRIKELEQQIAQGNQTIQDIPLTQIKRNIKQPRSSFYVVEQKIETLRRDGQKTPIILTKPPGSEFLQIFDGECRVRAANELGWETIEAIVIPHDEENYETDVLVSALYDDGLNSLDLAFNLANQINKKLPHLTYGAIATKLNSALTRIRRAKRKELIAGLEKKGAEQQDKVLAELDLSKDELVIFATILYFGQNLSSVNSKKFPFLNASPEVVKAIREKGLKDSQALAIDRITPSNRLLEINEETAAKLRREIVQTCIEYSLEIKETKAEIDKAIAPYLKQKNINPNKIVKKAIATIQAIKVDNLEQEQKQLLIEALEEKIKLIGDY